MKNSRIAFEVSDKDASVPVGYAEISCHLIFDVNMDSTQKARYVASSHLTDPPSSINYESVLG